MKIKVFNIDYDITCDDIYDCLDYVLEAGDLLFATPDLSEIDVDMDIADNTEEDTWAVIFTDIDDETVYYYNIESVDADEGRVHCKLFDKQSVEGFALDIAADLPEFCYFEIDADDLDDPTDLDDIVADLISNETDYLVQSFDYEIIGE